MCVCGNALGPACTSVRAKSRVRGGTVVRQDIHKEDLEDVTLSSFTKRRNI